jgi:DNA end-binding protein Ku
MWKASLEIADLRVPVKLYAAAEDRDIHFRLVHAADQIPVQQRMVDPRSGEPVEPSRVRRGIELARGLYVVLDESDLDAIAPKPSRSIEVVRFVPSAAVDPGWYLRPYFLGPDGDGADYAALLEALAATGVRGVARWTMRGRRYFGALAAHDRHLALIALRSAEEVIAWKELEPLEGKPANAGERRLAEQLVAALDAPFDPAELKDEYRERVLAFLRAKAKGRRTAPPREAMPKPVSDLSAALKRSLATARRGRAA